MKKIEFKKGQWEKDLVHAYPFRFTESPQFMQGEDFIVNKEDPSREDGYDYVSLMDKKAYPLGTKISAVCLFEDFGAPLITISDELYTDENGNYKYKNYYEAVVWEEGINVWRIEYVDSEVRVDLVAGVNILLDARVKHNVSVEIWDKRLIVKINGRYINLMAPKLPQNVYLGITACENINKFYSMTVETDVKKDEKTFYGM